MNTKISTLMAAGAVLLAVTSCSESWNPAPAEGHGTLSLKSMGVNVNTTATTVNSRAESSAIDLKPFMVKVVPVDGAGQTSTFTYGTMPEVLSLPLGQYRVDVESHQVQPAEWDRPYYKGSSKTFTIENNKLTEIGVVTCVFSSLKVTVAYTDKLREAMGDDVTVTVLANTGGTLVYTPTETRAGYFEVVEGSTTLVATFEGTVSGVRTSSVVTFGEVKPGIHYILTFNVKDGPEPPVQTGTVDPSGIGVEGVVNEEDINGSVKPGDDPTLSDNDRPGQEEGGDEPNPPTPPTPGDEDNIKFTSNTLDLEGVNDAATFTGDAIVTITSVNGFSHMIVKIDSEGLTSEVLEGVGLAKEFDLANPAVTELSDGTVKDITEGLQGLGFPTGAQVTGTTEPIEFNITQFVPLLTIYPGNSNFIITVTDKEGVQKSMTLKFKS